MSNKDPAPVKMEMECYIDHVEWKYPPATEMYGDGHYYLPGVTGPTLELGFITQSGYGKDKIRFSTEHCTITGDQKRMNVTGKKPVKFTVEIPSLTDEEFAEIEERAKARDEIYKLKSEVRHLQDKIDKLERKYQ
jgi:hypothetical protein